MSARAILRNATPPIVWRALKQLTPRRFLSSTDDFVRTAEFVRDDFAKLLGYINPGMLSTGNLALFDYCIRNLRSNAPIVEIGSFAGLSLNNMIHLLKTHRRNNHVFSVDEWNGEGHGAPEECIPGSCITWEEYKSHTIDTFRRNVSLFSRDRMPHHIVSNSDGFFASWQEGETRSDFFGKQVTLGGPISFAYIDGDHSYEQSRRDFENVDKVLEVDGFIVFDDSADNTSWGSHRTAAEAAGREDYRLVDKNPNYCIQKVRRA